MVEREDLQAELRDVYGELRDMEAELPMLRDNVAKSIHALDVHENKIRALKTRINQIEDMILRL